MINYTLTGYNRFLDGKQWNSLTRFDQKYFTKREKGEWYEDSMQICDSLIGSFKIESVVDFGCGNGVYLKIFQKRGIKEVKGYDGSKTALSNSMMPQVEYADLRQPILTSMPYDLVLCIEVAPYLHEKYENRLFSNLIEATHDKSIICFSASDMYTGGIYHINLKSKHYWIQKFHILGFSYQEENTKKILQTLSLQTMYWLEDNLMIFSKKVVHS